MCVCVCDGPAVCPVASQGWKFVNEMLQFFSSISPLKVE